MGKIIGIDLGTTNSVVAVMERGQPKVIPNTEGSRLTPSMVAFDEGGKVLVGEAARRRVLVDPETTVVSAKRFIGLGANDPIVRRAPCKVVTAPGGDLAFEIFRVRHSPTEICARILTQLKRAAADYLGEPVTGAVVSVPVAFNERQRQAIRDAGAIAGLEIKRIINEPIAVGLAYGIRKTKEQLIAVCSMGGGVFEVSILEVGDKVVEGVAGCGDNHLGGDDLDHRLIDWLVGEFRKDTSIDVGADKKVIQRLREAAERAKLELSECQETEIHLPALAVDASGPKHLQKTLSRAMFENLIEDLVERTIVSCRRALADAGKLVTDLHAVVLAGGSTRIPRVAARLEEFFGCKADRSMNADEAVALGAAIQAGCLSGDLKDILLLDTTSLSLAIEVAGGVANVLIPRNTTIPTRKTELVSIPTADHTAVSLHVIQGERPAAKDNPTIGRFQLTGLPSVPPGVRPIEVTFDIDANAVVHVTAKDEATGLGETFRIGMPSAFGGDSRPATAGTVAATLPRKDVPPAAPSRSRNTKQITQDPQDVEVTRDRIASAGMALLGLLSTTWGMGLFLLAIGSHDTIGMRISFGILAVLVGLFGLGMLSVGGRSLFTGAPRFRATSAGVWFGGGSIIPWSEVKQVFEGEVRASFHGVRMREKRVSFVFYRRATLLRAPITCWFSTPFSAGDIDLSIYDSVRAAPLLISRIEVARRRSPRR
jgi:molecular chaperone DnaK